ncbi:MAG TPA: winged helix-turn-helix domain-containing protein [Capillimicrobium sp.]
MPRTSTTSSVADTKMAKAMSHPVRVQALNILNQRVASPSDIAEEIGLPIANVAYHVRALLQLGCIEEVETRPVRGALEHRYRALRRAFVEPDEWATMPDSARHDMVATCAETGFGELAKAMQAGVFAEAHDHHMSYTALRLDEQGYSELNGMLATVLDRALAMQAECAARIADGEAGGQERRTHLNIHHFMDQPPAEAQEPAKG